MTGITQTMAKGKPVKPDSRLLLVTRKQATGCVITQNRPLHEILGHADLIKAGIVAAGEAEGFSVAVQGGKVVSLFANSMLNSAESGFVLATEKTAAVLDALGAYGAKIFGY